MHISDSLVGVIIGGALALAGSFATTLWMEWRQAEALRSALRAEISAVLDIAEARRHVEFAKATVELWKQGKEAKFEYFGADNEKIDDVFRANAGNIGKIGKILAADVACFYMRLTAVRINTRMFERDGVGQTLDTATKIYHFEHALELWAKTKMLGESLISRL